MSTGYPQGALYYLFYRMQENQTAVVESYFRKLRDSDTSNKAFALKSLAFLATQSKLSVKQNVEQLVAELEIALTVQDVPPLTIVGLSGHCGNQSARTTHHRIR